MMPATSQLSMTVFRFQRSTSAPAGNPINSDAAAPVPSTSPAVAGESVIASTRRGKAIPTVLPPNSESAWLTHNRR